MHVANTLKASNTMQQTHAVCGELAHRMAKCDIGIKNMKSLRVKQYYTSYTVNCITEYHCTYIPLGGRETILGMLLVSFEPPLA